MNILFDENVPYKFVEGLQNIESANNKSFCKADINHPRFLKKEGASDFEIIALAGEQKATIIIFDKDFKHIKNYYPLYKKHEVGIVFLKLQKQDSNYWGIVKLIITKWEDIKLKLKDIEPPFAFQVSKDGIQRQDF